MNEKEFLENLFLVYMGVAIEKGTDAAEKAVEAVLLSGINHSPGPHCSDCPAFDDCEMYLEWKNGLQ